MITVTFKKDTTGLDYLDKHQDDFLDDALRKVSEYVVDYIKSNWTATSPSSPGEPPAVVSGTLDASVSTEAAGRSAGGQFTSSKHVHTRVVHVKAPYANILEYGSAKMAPRPFVRPALDAARPEMKRQIIARFKSRWG